MDDIRKYQATARAGDAEEDSFLNRLMAISRATVLEEMASGVAHELNQPLGAIVTFAQAGERIVKRPDSTPESIGEVFRLISKEALAAADGIRRMRRLFERASLVKKPTAMVELLTELAPMLELLGQQTGVPLRMETDPAACSVSIDRLRIQFVLFTLVQNACEACQITASGSGAGSVIVRMQSDRYGIELSVTDSGPGISAEHRAQIFHPFFTTKPAGTGLGLTAARAIIEAHQGSIGFENISDRGARFWFRLPASEVDEGS